MKKTETLLRTCRVATRLTLKKVGQAVDIDESLLSRMETGQRAPSAAQARRLLRFYRAKGVAKNLTELHFLYPEDHLCQTR